MALRIFGGGPADVTSNANGDVVAGVQLRVYTAANGGQRVTELYDLTGSPLASVVESSSDPSMRGRIAFQADAQYDVLFLDAGYGMRWAVGAQDAFSAASSALSKATDALALAQQTVTEEALNARVDSVKAEVDGWIHGAGSPVSHLDRARVACVFPAEKVGDEVYVAPQGFSINRTANELYVSYGSGTDNTQRFEVRDLTTGERLSYRVISADVQSYSEALPWFYNNLQELCFIVWLQASATTPTRYQIFNFDTGELSAKIPINGKVRGDHFGDQFVTSDAYGSTASVFWVYSWESIKAGSPVLLQTVPMQAPGSTAAKVQGTTTVGSHFFIYGGASADNPTVTVYNNLGQIESVRSWPRKDLARIVESTSSHQFTVDNFYWEGEGITSDAGRVYTGHYVSDLNLPGTSAIRQVIILEHGDPTSPAMAPQTVTGFAMTGRAGLTLGPGKSAAGHGYPPSFERDGIRVKLRGHIGNADGANMEPGSAGHLLATLPAGFRPKQDWVTVCGVSGQSYAKLTRIVVSPTGDIIAFPSEVISWASIDGVEIDLE